MKLITLAAVILAPLCAFAGSDPLPFFPLPLTQTAGAPSNGTNCIQTITIGGTPTGGTFTLKYKGFVTGPITWSSTNATLVSNIDTALEALPTVSAGAGGGVTTAVGTMTAGIGTITVTFTGNNAKLLIPAVTVVNNSMTGSSPTVAVAITTAGVTADGRSSAIGQINIDSTNGVLYQNQGAAPNVSWVKVSTQ